MPKKSKLKFFQVPDELGARWGVAEWIERPLLMLEVRGSNPGNSASKTTSLPPKPNGSPRSRAHPWTSELRVRGGVKQKKKKNISVPCLPKDMMKLKSENYPAVLCLREVSLCSRKGLTCRSGSDDFTLLLMTVSSLF